MVTIKRAQFRVITWGHFPAHFLLCFSLLTLNPVHGAESSRPSNPATHFPSPLEPRQTLSHFQLETGLRVELVAAEPLVVAPVAMAFDERGRLFVAENRGYPTGPGPDQPPAGQIAMLEDRDRDGYFETRITFADQLTYPNGLMPWKGGLLVTCAPDLLFLQDTNRDGRCDLRTVLFTGFATNGSTQLRVGYPTLSPEGWIYLASGLTGGKIVSPLHPGMPVVDIGGGDFRFSPDFGKFEMVDGKAQFGLAIDEYAERFITMNRVHIKHVVLPSRYLRRNPHLLFSETVQNVPESMVPEPLKGHLAAARIYPISENVTTADSHAGTFTAACGLLLYRGTALPPKYRGQAFTCDPTGNLIHWDQLLPNGPTFLARRAEEKKEFMATADGWFRPVFLANGPDGALYVCDMYRKTIEHPQYLPEEIRKRTDFESGKDRGRIYRVVTENFRREKRKPAGSLPMPKHGPALEEQRGALIPAVARNLDHANGWHRDTAFRLLLELGPASTLRVKKEGGEIFSNPRSLPEAQALALQLLQEKGVLDDALLLKGFRRSDPSVRKVAIELAESRLKNPAAADQWLEPLTQLAEDPSPAVRFRSALALGEINHDQKIKPLAKIALTDAKERWTRAAVLSGVNGKGQAFLQELIQQVASTPGSKKDEADLLLVFNDSARLVSAENPKQFAESLEMILAPTGEENQSWQIAAVNGLFEGLKPDSSQATEKLLKDNPHAARLPDLIRAARRIVEGDDKSELRIASISLLGMAGSEQDGAGLLELLQTKESVPVQSTVIRALLRRPSPEPIETILQEDRWSRLTPAVKEIFLQGVIVNNRHLPVLLEAIENKTLDPSVLDAARRNQLQKHPNTEIRTRAEKLFESSAGSDRMKVYDDYKSVLALKTQPGRGREMFKLHCASCHRLDREGIEVGPDLFAIRNQPKEAILLHVLIPEHEIVPGFTGYVIETKGGETLNGLIASETPTSITIKQPLGIEKTISRNEVISLNSIGSLMPQEMEKNMTRQEMADLIAYLKGE